MEEQDTMKITSSAKSCSGLYKNICYYSKGEKNKKFVALYGIFKQDKATGEILGYVEHSFSMGWSKDRVRLWSLEDAQYFLKRDFKDEKDSKIFIVRLTNRGENANILADFEQRKRDSLAGTMKKFEFRNILWRAVA